MLRSFPNFVLLIVVYILIETYHRAATSEAVSLWKLVNRVCELHPRLSTATEYPEVYAVAHLVLRAWQHREEYLQAQQKDVEKPWCVMKFTSALSAPDESTFNTTNGLDDLADFDFDLIDWSFWETGRFDQVGHGTDM